MAWFSEYIILIGAAILGYVFSELLKEVGWNEKQAHSIVVLLGLGVLAFLAYWLQPLFMYGRLQAIPLTGFYGSDYFNFTIAIMAGNLVKIAERFVLKKQKPTLY